MKNKPGEVLDILKEYTEKYYIKNEYAFIEKCQFGKPSSILLFKILILERYFNLNLIELFYLLIDRNSFKNFIDREALPSMDLIIKYKTTLADKQFLSDVFQEIELLLINDNIHIEKGRCIELSADITWQIKNSTNEETKVKSEVISEILLEEYNFPFFIRSDTTDFDVYAEVMIQEIYKLNLSFEPNFIIDCGANIGLTSVFLKRQYPNSLIISIEPEHSNYLLLERNIHPYLPSIIPLHGAIWNKKIDLNLFNGPDKGNWGFMVDEKIHPEISTVRSFTLKEIMDKYNSSTIDLLKVDIEGAEKELFSSNYEYWLPRTKVLIIETHDRLKRGCSKSIFAALASYNFSLDIKGNTLIFHRN